MGQNITKLPFNIWCILTLKTFQFYQKEKPEIEWYETFVPFHTVHTPNATLEKRKQVPMMQGH